MPLLRDEDVAIWCCVNAHLYQIIEFKVGGPAPIAKFCGKCSEPYLTRCPNKDCPHPTYHPSDVYSDAHPPCRAMIPWAKARKNSDEVGPGFHSQLVGTGTYMGKQLPTYAPVPELTREERQDLIVPPSGRLPKVGAITIEDRQRVEQSNLARYVLATNAAVDGRLRQVVRGVLGFFAARGRVVGKGVDKGLEDAVALLVKTVIVAAVVLVAATCGINLVLR